MVVARPLPKKASPAKKILRFNSLQKVENLL
jgi:hypothetical protein